MCGHTEREGEGGAHIRRLGDLVRGVRSYIARERETMRCDVWGVFVWSYFD